MPPRSGAAANRQSPTKQHSLLTIHSHSTPSSPPPVDLSTPSGLKSLITELTAAGFDPSQRCIVIGEGVLPYLPADAVAPLIADLSALAAPGSRLLFDFLHSDALGMLGGGGAAGAAAGAASGGAAGEALPGIASLAAAAEAKGSPLCSGLQPSFSGAPALLAWRC